MRIRVCALFAVLAAALVATSPAAAADTPFTVIGSVSNHSGTTIPFFTSSFSYNGTTFDPKGSFIHSDTSCESALMSEANTFEFVLIRRIAFSEP